MLERWLIIYDIRDPRRLRRIAKMMEHYGIRVQKSVFEVMCRNSVTKAMRREAREFMEDEDSFIVFNLCAKCWQKRRQIGVTEDGPNDDAPFLVL